MTFIMITLNSYYEKFSDGRVVCIDDEVPFELPNGWEWVRLNAVCSKFSTGPFGTMLHKTDYVESNGIAVINPTNISTPQINCENIKMVPPKKYKELLSYKVEAGDIVLARRGDLSKCAIITTDEDGWLAGTGTFFLRVLDLKLKFFTILYNSDYIQSSLLGDSIGTTMDNLNQTLLANVLLPIPPLQEQARIIDIIEKVEPKINDFERSKNKLNILNSAIKEMLKKSILQESIKGRLVPQDSTDKPACELLKRIKDEKERLIKEKKIKRDKNESVIFKGDDNRYYEQTGKDVRCIDDEIPMDLPDGWVYTRLGMIGYWGSGSTPAKGHPEYYGGNIPWLRTGELNNSIVYDTEIKITKKALQECHFRINKPGDVLIAMYGATIGKVAIAGTEMTTNQACCGCTPFGVLNEYLFYFLMANKDNFTKQGEGGAQPNISKEKITSYLFPLPPLAEQYRIVQKLKELLAKLK